MIIRTQQVAATMTKEKARELTDRIRKAVDNLWELLIEAHERKAWKLLGYDTWADYVNAEFSMSRARSYQIIDQGRVIHALREAAGDLSTQGGQKETGRGHTRTLSAPNVEIDISEKAARDIKDDLPEVTAEIRDRVSKGEAPRRAANAAVNAKRAEKEKAREAKKAEQAKNDAAREQARAALPDAIKRQEAYKANGAVAGKPAGLSPQERIAELEEAVRALETENAALKAENKLFAGMKVEFDKGGFAEVIKGKDEVISVQATRIERESRDKVSWKNSSDMWRKRAEESGWSNEIEIEIPGRAHA